MATFTTNWYLYKTYRTPTSKKPQTRIPEPATRTHGSKKKTGTNSNNQEAENRTVEFEEVLLEAIDEGLSLLGESSKQVVYFHLEKTFNMKRTEIPHRIEEFTDSMEKLLGTGAKILEIHIMKCIFKRVDCDFKHYPKQKNWTFKEYVASLEEANVRGKRLDHKRCKLHTNNLRESEGAANWISRASDFIVL